jgi:hypothetical protein
MGKKGYSQISVRSKGSFPFYLGKVENPSSGGREISGEAVERYVREGERQLVK